MTDESETPHRSGSRNRNHNLESEGGTIGARRRRVAVVQHGLGDFEDVDGLTSFAKISSGGDAKGLCEQNLNTYLTGSSKITFVHRDELLISAQFLDLIRRLHGTSIPWMALDFPSAR